MILPFVIGAGCGGAGVWMMHRLGMLSERSGLAVLVCAIALFYPVFALASDAHLGHFAFHFVIFALFCAAAAWGFRTGSAALAGLLIAHGAFDIVMMAFENPAPVWWPAFCAGIDIVFGAALLWLLQRREIPA